MATMLRRILTHLHHTPACLACSLGLACYLCGASMSAVALEYKTVAVPKAILYDAPSAQGKKLYLLGQGYPVEVIVNLGDWVKVRDNQGGLNWIEARQLSDVRTVLLTRPSELRQSADAASSLLATLDKDVVVEVIEPAKNGWLKVKHKDGLTGYLLVNAVWGW